MITRYFSHLSLPPSLLPPLPIPSLCQKNYSTIVRTKDLDSSLMVVSDSSEAVTLLLSNQIVVLIVLFIFSFSLTPYLPIFIPNPSSSFSPSSPYLPFLHPLQLSSPAVMIQRVCRTKCFKTGFNCHTRESETIICFVFNCIEIQK